MGIFEAGRNWARRIKRDGVSLWFADRKAKPTSRWGAVMVIGIWIAVGAALWRWLRPVFAAG